MKKDGYYSSGEFARMAGVTLRTIRYYDQVNLLKPTYVNENGTRFYTDTDFAKLQQILLFKYLGLSLDEIRDMTVGEPDYHYLENVLSVQQKLIQDRIEQMQLVEKAIQNTTTALQNKQEIDWSQMLNLIHLTNMESSMKNQYQNASNISARIRLHALYSQNKQGWFPWIYEQLCKIIHQHFSNNAPISILELGCGDGSLWKDKRSQLPANFHIHLTDISEGMLRDTRRSLGAEDNHFTYTKCDCENLPFEDETYDIVIANHVLFYCDNIENACNEIRRVLKSNGYLISGTYGKKHMQEVSKLVQTFDNRIVLAADNLYDRFGKENGASILQPYFRHISWLEYEDNLFVPDSEALISYVLSCHGNQNQYILDKYQDFQAFVKRKVKNGFYITKDAGIFLGEKK